MAESLSKMAQRTLKELESLVGCPAEGVVGVHKDGDGWVVEVEVLEIGRVPETTDVLPPTRSLSTPTASSPATTVCAATCGRRWRTEMTQSPEGPVSLSQGPVFVGNRTPRPESLADVLERVLDKGIVIVGDIQVRLLDIELLTIKLRLMIASVDRAREMGINWWEGDPFVTNLEEGDDSGASDRELELQQRVEALERRLGSDGQEQQLEGQPERQREGEESRRG